MMMLQCQAQRQLQVAGGASLNAFPLVEEWLNESSDRQLALDYVGSRKRKAMDSYHSIVDFLFCEIFIDFQPACFRFYDGKGPNLQGHPAYNDVQRAKWEKRLLAGLNLAYEIFKARRVQSWTQFRLQVLALEIAA